MQNLYVFLNLTRKLYYGSLREGGEVGVVCTSKLIQCNGVRGRNMVCPRFRYRGSWK